jgi:Tetracyclin repressor-like, C-terminal domain
MLWTVLFGAVSLEVFGQYGPDTFAEPGLLFEHQVTSAVTTLAAQTGSPGPGARGAGRAGGPGR